MIIGGCYNHDVASIEGHQFFAELQLKDLHQTFNGLELSQMDHTYGRRTKGIDSIVFNPNLRKYMEVSGLFETNEILNTDHISHVIDANLEVYFQEDFSG